MPSVPEGALGVVIAVPGPLHRQLHHWRASFGEDPASLVPAHVTVLTHGIAGDVDDAVRTVTAVAATVDPFDVVVRGTGTFAPRSPVTYLKVTAGAGECVALHERILARGIGSGSPFPYHPHVTLAQGAAPEVLDEALIRFAGFAARFPATHLGVHRATRDGWEQVGAAPLGG